MGVQKILIIDDHPIFRQALKNILAHEDRIEIIGECSDGDQAYEKVMELGPDLLLLDIEMPILDGPSLLKKLNEHENRPKVIVISQANEPHRLKQLLEAGVEGHILKTEDSQNILNAIEQVSKGERYFSSKIANSFYQMLSHDSKVSSEEDIEVESKESLSKREIEVLRFVSEGKTNKEVGATLGCSENTIKSHKTNIMRKINVRNSVEMTHWYLKNF